MNIITELKLTLFRHRKLFIIKYTTYIIILKLVKVYTLDFIILKNSLFIF